MSLRVGIVDNDEFFVKRFCMSMNSKFSDLEVLNFPSIEQAQTAAENSLLQLLLVNSSFVSKYFCENLIPLQCKTAVLCDDAAEVEDCSLPCVCKYKSVDEWYVLICQFCSCEPLLDYKGGDKSTQWQNKTCLFVAGGIGTTGASDAASQFGHFLYKEGFNSAVLEPFLGSGESVWKMVEDVKKACKVTLVCLSEFDNDSIVIPFINADVIVFVSNGESGENKNIEYLIHKLPALTALPLEEICKKSYLLYNHFDYDSGVIFRNNQIGRLGGLDNEKNSVAAFEKLVTVLDV